MTITFHTEINKITEGVPYALIYAEVLRGGDFVASHSAHLPYYGLRDGQISNAIAAPIWALKQFAELHGETVPQSVVDDAVARLVAVSTGDGSAGRKFAAARKSLGMTQQQFADHIGRSLAIIGKWERDEQPVDSLAARYMTALLSGWRPDDWLK